MQCSHCNQEHPAGTRFCPLTGKKILMPEVCPECGKPVDPNWLHCSYCGRKLIHAEGIANQPEVQATGYPPAPVTTPGLSKTKTGSPKVRRLMVAGGIGGLLIVAGVVLIAFWSGPSAEQSATMAAAMWTATLTPTAPPFVETAGRIVFESNRDGNLEIYVMNADGSAQTNFTNNPADDSAPSWSADGQKITFASLRDGNWEIYVMNADGSNQTRLTNNPASDGVPAWSADGQKILFESNRDGNAEIYVMNADGSNQTRLTNNPANDGVPSWSADGQKITFASLRDGNWEIYVMNADGSNQTRLTNNPANDGVPTWSGDGQKIVFESNRDGNGEIYVMNADGSNQTRLTNNPANDSLPGCSKDGQKIALTSIRDGNWEIYVMNADGSAQTRLTNNPASDGVPHWSPGAPVVSIASVANTPTAPPVEEKYEQVNPSELSIDFQADIPGEVRWDVDGNITAFGGGKVTQFAVGGKPIELVSDDLLLEGEEVFIVTKDYGKIKVTFNSNFTISLWLKPSQKAKLIELTK